MGAPEGCEALGVQARGRGVARYVLARMAAAVEAEDIGQVPEDPTVIASDVRRKVREGRIWVGGRSKDPTNRGAHEAIRPDQTVNPAPR